MTKIEVQKEVKRLPRDEQLEIADEVYSSLSGDVEFGLTPEPKGMLEARLAEAKANPDAGVPVEDAHREIRERLQ